jgi:hypothetical protein
MPAPKGNQFWKVRSSSGRKPIFESDEKLLTSCMEYFEWVEENPLIECKVTQYQGEQITMNVPKMRAMTLDGLCIFLDIAIETWKNYKKREDFLAVTEYVEKVIRNQKFVGASADMLNANIIARDLGLTDKVDTTIANPDGTNIGSSDVEIARKLAHVLDKALRAKKDSE